jgi:uncharacterized RDD family membrane protein YckC
MAQNKKENPDRPRGRYVWDPEKLAWVETTEVSKAEQAQVMEGTLAEAAREEGVVAEIEPTEVVLPYQGAWIRAGGAIIDLIILAIVTLILDYTLGRAVHGLPGYALPIYGLIYFVGFWLWRGQTPGKMLVGGKIVKADGGPVDLGRALLRYLLYFFPIYAPIPFSARLVNGMLVIALPVICLIVMGFNGKKRGIHDFVAGTVVIKSRVPISQAQDAVGAQAEQTNTGEPDTTE